MWTCISKTMLLFDAREQRRIHYSNEDKDEDDKIDASSVFLDDYDMEPSYV